MNAFIVDYGDVKRTTKGARRGRTNLAEADWENLGVEEGPVIASNWRGVCCKKPLDLSPLRGLKIECLKASYMYVVARYDGLPPREIGENWTLEREPRGDELRNQTGRGDNLYRVKYEVIITWHVLEVSRFAASSKNDYFNESSSNWNTELAWFVL